MPALSVSIWHDAVTGEIVAIGRANGDDTVVPVAATGQGLIEVEVEEENLSDLPRTHIVDPRTRQFVRRYDEQVESRQ